MENILKDKDFMQYVYARIVCALDDEDYSEIQTRISKTGERLPLEIRREYEDLACEIEAKAQELCYLRGFKDALNLLR